MATTSDICSFTVLLQMGITLINLHTQNVEIGRAYERGGAACLSVLTDEKYFKVHLLQTLLEVTSSLMQYPYKPVSWLKQVKDVAHQEEVVRVLTNTLQISNCPHMLFYGPPGTGKTTTALAFTHQLFGPELYKSRLLELNVSDDRGINVVRTKIKKNFCRGCWFWSASRRLSMSTIQDHHSR